MNREQVAKVLDEAKSEKPDAILICYKVGNEYKLNITAGIEAHFMRDLVTMQLNKSAFPNKLEVQSGNTEQPN